MDFHTLRGKWWYRSLIVLFGILFLVITYTIFLLNKPVQQSGMEYQLRCANGKAFGNFDSIILNANRDDFLAAEAQNAASKRCSNTDLTTSELMSLPDESLSSSGRNYTIEDTYSFEFALRCFILLIALTGAFLSVWTLRTIFIYVVVGEFILYSRPDLKSNLQAIAVFVCSFLWLLATLLLLAICIEALSNGGLTHPYRIFVVGGISLIFEFTIPVYLFWLRKKSLCNDKILT